MAAVATALALFFATKDSIHQHTLGLPITWSKSLWWKAMEWYAWAALAPLIFGACRMLDLSAAPGRTILAHLGFGAIAGLVHCSVLATGARIEAQVLQTGLSWARLYEFVFANHFHEDVLTYAAIVSVWYALDFHQRFRDRERRAAELEASLAQARLEALKSQLHPHFLFNTLNGIASLTYENPKAAHRMIARLSELLRLSLNSQDHQEVSLQSELEFGRRYLELEQIRFGSRLAVEMDIAPETTEACVPNLLLQPLLENAVKHGIAPFASPGRISICSRRERGVLRLRVADNGPGLKLADGAAEGHGIGLKNTRARLKELYGDNQRVELKSEADGGLAVEISLPFRTTGAAQAGL